MLLQRTQFGQLGQPAGQEELLHRAVAPQVQKNAVGALAIAAGAARLLVVGIEAGGHLVVQHEADVRFVDPHAEGIGGHHHAQLARHERVLCGAPFAGAPPAVVQARGLAGGRQFGEERLGRLHRGGVDDAAALEARHQRERAPQLVFLAHRRLDRVVQVGPVRAGVDEAGARNAELLHDLPGHFAVRRGRERQHHRMVQRAHRRTQLEVGGPEVVPPLRNAMRLVDHEQGGRVPLEQREEIGVGQALRRAEDHARRTVGDGRLRVVDLLCGALAVELHGAHARRVQLLALVLHERDQGRDHHRLPRREHRGHLVAQRFSGARGHDGERRFAADHAIDHAALPGPQPPMAEHLVQHAVNGCFRGGAGALLADGGPRRRLRFLRRWLLVVLWHA